MRSTVASTAELSSSTISTSSTDPIRSARSSPVRPTQNASGRNHAARDSSWPNASSSRTASMNPASELREALINRRSPVSPLYGLSITLSPLDGPCITARNLARNFRNRFVTNDLQARRMKKFFQTRRTLLKLGMFAPLFGCAGFGGQKLGFAAVPVSTADRIVVPPGYRADVLYAWGDPTGAAAVDFRWDASNGATEQALQAGMHHDGMELFPLDGNRALLAINHEYTDDGLLHPDGMKTWTADKVRKSQAAHGISVIEIEQAGGNWRVVRPSKYARRITAETQMAFSGPAAGSALLGGRQTLGTINNCAAGRTPWG